MTLPKQSPPVARRSEGIGRTVRPAAIEPAQDARGSKIDWKCTTVQADPHNTSASESVLSYNIPGATSGWMVVDFPCSPDA